MSDLFGDFNKILKKDLFPILVKYLKDPNKKITYNINNILNDPHIFLTDIFEKVSKNKDRNVNQGDYKDIENINDLESSLDNENDEYDELLKRLNVIEENMVQLEKILKDKN